MIEIIRFPPSDSKPLVFRPPERWEVARLGPGLSSTCHTLHLSEGLSASSHAQVCTRHPSGYFPSSLISSSHFFSPGPNGPGEKKWLEEIKGGRSQPEGCLVHTWARGAFHNRSFVEAQESWRKGRAQVVLPGTVTAAQTPVAWSLKVGIG